MFEKVDCGNELRINVCYQDPRKEFMLSPLWHEMFLPKMQVARQVLRTKIWSIIVRRYSLDWQYPHLKVFRSPF